MNLLNKMLRPLILFLTLALVFSCGKDESPVKEHVKINKTQTSGNLKALLVNAKKVSVDVIYEAGADPYIGSNFRNKPYWSVFETNIKAIYEARGMNVEVVVPSELSDMTLIPVQNKDSWTASEINDLAKKYKKIATTSSDAVIQAVFVQGYFNNGESTNTSVIGINITGTTVIAIFKDVIKAMHQDKDGPTAKFTEQSTLVHEFGHAIGLVNNGVKQVDPHHDSEHGAHCDNPNCVMYWQNEGAIEMYEYIARYMQSGSEIMYDASCMEDLKNY